MLIIAGMAAVTLTGCQQQDEVTETPTTEPSYVLADLALSLPPSSSGTRLDPGVTSGGDASSFRGISKLSIIPFTKRGKITKSDQPSIIVISNPISDYYTPIHESNNDELYRYYEKVFLNYGVASFLTYGQGAKTGKPENAASVNDKVFYGSLIPKVAGEEMNYIPERLTVSAGDLSFELETIYDDTDETTGNQNAPDEAKAIADYLTYIANTKVTVGATEYRWSKSNLINETLMGLYNSFISFLGSGKYGVIAGSAANVKAYVNELYRKLQDFKKDYTADKPEWAIADGIQSRIKGIGLSTDFTSQYDGFEIRYNDNNEVTSLGDTPADIAIYDNYPSHRHLPDGAAVLQWGRKVVDNTYGFIPQVQTTNTANVSSINRYTYPAELYYYGNSLIKTSDDEVPVSKYSGTGITTWKDVVDNLYTSGSVVSYNTKAVAIVDPMQYGVARLQGSVLATSSTLNDADNTLVSLTNDNNYSFPITGLIVSGQYPVNFDFTPKLDGASEDNEHFVYDSYLGSDPLYLTTSQTSPFYTMVMQTHDYEDVTVILELVNNSGTDFKGENGIVYRGTKFYLAGKVELSNGTPDSNLSESEQADVSNRVFTQDHTTVISMKVSSLAKAYNVMPNIQSGRLEVGVEINLKWEQATPKTIVFEE
jgi:hypothetical protein